MGVPDVIHMVKAGSTAVILSKLGEGGQGSVYEIERIDGIRHALKWYDFDQTREENREHAEDQRRAVERLVERPAPSRHFLWPEDIAVGLDDQGTAQSFGYIMPLKPNGYHMLSGMYRRTRPLAVTLPTLLTTAMELADAFLRLHLQGLCYRDISPNNVFMSVSTGDVMICDNDNVGVDGASSSRIRGTPLFMAPEIVRNDARPNAATDRHSLAVLLFYLLMAGHPLLGRARVGYPCQNRDALEEMLGERPLFVFDPLDSGNAPLDEADESMKRNWQFYPHGLRRLFEQAFTVGLHDPHARVMESIWRLELTRVRDLVTRCAECGRQMIFDPSETLSQCWGCGTDSQPPMRIDVGGTTVVLNEDTTITSHHLHRNYDFDDTVATVTRRSSGAWGLRNLTGSAWQATLPDGQSFEVHPHTAVALVPDLTLEISGMSAKLRWR